MNTKCYRPLLWSLLIVTAGCQTPPPTDQHGRPLIKKLSTIDIDLVETSPVVFNGKLYRFEYVRSGLSDDARTVLKEVDVRRILEWSIHYLQDPDVRAQTDEPRVAGGIEVTRYVQNRTREAAGIAYDGDLILEVLRLQNEYLAVLGAVGDAVADDHDDPDAIGTG